MAKFYVQAVLLTLRSLMSMQMVSGKDFPLPMNMTPAQIRLAKVQSMKHGRWYPYCLTLDDGKVLTIGGFDEWGVATTHSPRRTDPNSKSWSIKYDSTTSNTYTVGRLQYFCPPWPSFFWRKRPRLICPPVSLYPQAIFMPTSLVANSRSEQDYKDIEPPDWKMGICRQFFKLKEVYGNMVLLPLNNTASKPGELLILPAEALNMIILQLPLWSF